ENLARCVATLVAAGCRVAYADLTTADLRGYPIRVARAVATGLQPIHFGYGEERLGGHRLFELPRKLGLAAHVLGESDLNPCPHPLACRTCHAAVRGRHHAVAHLSPQLRAVAQRRRLRRAGLRGRGEDVSRRRRGRAAAAARLGAAAAPARARLLPELRGAPACAGRSRDAARRR